MGDPPASKDQAATVFEGLGNSANIQINTVHVDGKPGILVTTTALGWDKPEWMAIYFGANGLSVYMWEDTMPIQ